MVRGGEGCPGGEAPKRRWFLHADAIALASALGALGSLLVSVYALTATLEFRRELAYPEQVSHIADLFIDLYLDLRFPAAVEVGGKQYATVKQVRELIRGELRDESLGDQRAILDRFREASCYQGTWQNALAYELSLGLERVGAMVFTGVLPLETVLAVNASGFSEDWVYASRLIEQEIRQQGDPVSKLGEVSYARRHGEWLACVSALYMSKFWNSLREDLWASYLGSRPDILDKERRIRMLEDFLVSPRAVRSVEALVSED